MRITSIELAGTPREDEDNGLPRAFATLRMTEDNTIQIEVHSPDGRESRLAAPVHDLRTDGLSALARKRIKMRQWWRDRNRACETLSDMLEGHTGNWKSYLAIIEQLAHLG